MATGVKPRDEESRLSRVDLEAIQDAMKCKKFRDLLNEYCEEVRDPANQAIYQKEMTQLEKERGYDVTFINPKGGYVIKTSVAGDRKAFINICSSDNVQKPSCSAQEVNGLKGMNWQLPYSIIPPREDTDKNKQRCVIYDVVFHPDTMRMAEVNKRFRDLVNKTAFEGLQNTYNIQFDDNNCRFPKSQYKGMSTPAVIRKEDPNYKASKKDESEMDSELIDKLYPQKVFNEHEKSLNQIINNSKQEKETKDNCNKSSIEEIGYTVPKYVIKQQKNVDMQDFTYHRESKQYSAIPSHIVVEVNLPLLSTSKDCILDVKDKSFKLTSEKPAKYKLELTLPYIINEECGNATFDKTKHKLIVTLPVRVENFSSKTICRADSGIDSESNSFDEEDDNKCLVEEIVSESGNSQQITEKLNEQIEDEKFLLSSVGYVLPLYTYNVLDNTIAFTFHVKNTEPNSVQVKNKNNKVYIKFSTMGTGFVPLYYAAIILFDDGVKFIDTIGEAWDNNVILQLELGTDIPQHFSIGLSNNEMKKESLELSHISKSGHETIEKEEIENTAAIVEVTNSTSETNILVSTSKNNTESHTEREVVWIDSGSCESGAKSILRKSINMMRSFSESSTGDVASSIDYISSDCIPEESSLKKTVRFSDVIARQFYRYNSSIEGQKRKNQRKKSKKRNQERHRSESEAEDDSSISSQLSKPRLKSALKQRHDSGLADTSDAEVEFKYTMSDSEVTYGKMTYPSEKYIGSSDTDVKTALSESKISNNNDKSTNENSALSSRFSKTNDHIKSEYSNIQKNSPTCDNIKHNTNLYDSDKLNKGQYSEIKFKNDLIFDLDM